MNPKTLLILLILVRCTSTPPSKPTGVAPSSQSNSNSPMLILGIMGGRHLDIKPCGCSFNPRGGIEREYKVLSQWKENEDGQWLYTAVGPSFVPFQKTFDDKNLPAFITRAKLMMQAWKEMGLNVLSPVLSDTYFGIENLKAIEKEFSVPFVSTNLADAKTKQLLFKPYLEMTYSEKKIVVIGLSGQDRGVFEKRPNNVIAQEPSAAISTALNGLSYRPNLVVILSTLSQSERLKVQDQLSLAHVFVGHEPNGFEGVLDQGRWGVALPLPLRSFTLVHMNIPLDKTYKRVFYPPTASKISDFKKSAKQNLNEINLQLKKKSLTNARKTELLQKKQRLEDTLKRYEGIPESAGPDSAVLFMETTSLDASQEPKEKHFKEIWKDPNSEIEF